MSEFLLGRTRTWEPPPKYAHTSDRSMNLLSLGSVRSCAKVTSRNFRSFYFVYYPSNWWPVAVLITESVSVSLCIYASPSVSLSVSVAPTMSLSFSVLVTLCILCLSCSFPLYPRSLSLSLSHSFSFLFCISICVSVSVWVSVCLYVCLFRSPSQFASCKGQFPPWAQNDIQLNKADCVYRNPITDWRTSRGSPYLTLSLLSFNWRKEKIDVL